METRIKKALKKLGESMVDDIKLQLLRHTPNPKVASRNLLNSLKPVVPTGKKELTIVAKGAPYEVIVDKGRTPGAKHPPVESIRKWIQIKGIQARNIKPKSLPYAIVNSIHNEGIEGIDFTANTLKKFRPVISKSLGVEYEKELDRIIKEIKEELNKFE